MILQATVFIDNGVSMMMYSRIVKGPGIRFSTLKGCCDNSWGDSIYYSS